MKTIYFIRHGQSQANKDGVYAGWSDSPLTEKGRQQAHEAAKGAKDLGIEKIISSDLHRAYETACIVADILGIDRDAIVKSSKLREVDVGKLSGTTERGIPGTPGASELGYSHYYQIKDNPMQVEYVEHLRRRLEEFRDELSHYSEKTILLAGHDVSGLTLQQVLERRHDDVYTLPSFPNGSIVPFYEGIL